MYVCLPVRLSVLLNVCVCIGGVPTRENKYVKDTILYDVLGIDPGATQGDSRLTVPLLNQMTSAPSMVLVQQPPRSSCSFGLSADTYFSFLCFYSGL